MIHIEAIRNFIGFVQVLRKRYLQNTVLINSSAVVTVLVQAITLPIILANLPQKDYGLFQFVLALEMWFDAFTAHHMTKGSKRGIARNLNGTFLYVFFVRLKLFVLAAFLLATIAVLVLWYGNTTLAVLMLVMAAFLVLGFLPQTSFQSFFIAKKEFKKLALLNSVIAFAVPVGGMVAALLTQNVVVFALTQLGLILVAGVGILLYTIISYNLVASWRKKEIDKEVYGYGVKMVPANIASTSAKKAPEFIIGPFFGFDQLASYAVASRLELLISKVLLGSHKILYADFAKMKWEDLIAKVNAKLKEGFALSVLVAVALVTAGYAYVTFFFPENYQVAKTYLIILGFGLPPVIMQGIMQTILEVAFRHKELTLIFVAPGIVKILLIVAAGLLFGVIGIVWAISIAAWITYFFSYFLTLKRELVFRMFKVS